MSGMEFHPEQAIGDGLLQLGKQKLLRFVSLLCLHLKAELGSRTYRGGIFPENICTDGEGHFAIGPAKMEKWSGQELEFIAPEMYWHGEASPAADVYSLALLVYYGLCEGKLPFDTATGSGQLARMSGKALPAPKNAGKRLTEVLEKATAFQAADRYQSPGELQIMLESCMDNKYLSGNSGAEVVFKKEEEELSDIERMMVDIIEHGAEAEERDEPVSLEGLSQEEIAGLEKPPAQPHEEEDISAAVEEYFGSPSGEETRIMPSLAADEPEDVRVYEPSREKKDRQPIPILTEEKYPELAPVVLHRQTPHVPESAQEPEEKKQPEPEAELISTPQALRKRRNLRPLAIVLVVCLSLVAGALAVNLYWKRGATPTRINSTPDPQKLMGPAAQATIQPSAEATPHPIVVTTPTNAPQQAPKYRVYVSDLSWETARSACWDQDGYLAVISDQEELREIIALVEEYPELDYVWIGCHRADDRMVWETGEEVDFYPWGANEPSKKDAYDFAYEDYVLLRREGTRWVYNDSRNDPAGAFPDFYSGKMGYVCEFNR